MRKRFLFLLLLAFHINANAQLVVSDPSSIAQRAMNFIDQMAEAIEEKYAMYEQVEAAIQQAELIKKNMDKYQKVMDWVKSGKEVIRVIQTIEDFGNEINKFRIHLTESEFLNQEEQYFYFCKSFEIYEDAKLYVADIKKYISDFKNEDDAGLTSAERIQLLRNIRTDIESMRQKVNMIRHEAENINNKKKNICDRTCNIYGTFNIAVK